MSVERSKNFMLAKQISIKYPIETGQPFFFMHIPKTAGLTLHRILDNLFPAPLICPIITLRGLLQFPPEQLPNYQLYRGHFSYNFAYSLPKFPLIMTMLRDPIERTISQYEYSRSDPSNGKLHNLAQSLTLLEYLKDPLGRASIHNLQTRFIGIPLDARLTKGQVAYPIHLGIDVAKERLEAFEFIGITEKFQASMDLLSYTFSLPPIREYQRLNTTSRRIQRHELEDQVIEAILEANKDDLELYEYGLRLFEQRYVQMGHELVTKEYEGISLQKPTPTEIDLTFDQPIDGWGWYPADYITELGYVRWIGPKLKATLYFVLKADKDLIVEFEVLKPLSDSLLEGLRLEVNNYTVPLNYSISDNSTYIFSGIIPQSAISTFSTFTFHVPETIIPHEINPEYDDTRPLGLAFHRLKIQPAFEVVHTEVDLIFDQSISGWGWYPSDYIPDFGYMRWMGPKPQSTLYIALEDDTDRGVEFEVLRPLSASLLDNLRLEVNGFDIPLTYALSKRATYVFSGIIPQAAISTLSTFTFHIPETVIPHEINSNNDDTRSLGLAFHHLKIVHPFKIIRSSCAEPLSQADIQVQLATSDTEFEMAPDEKQVVKVKVYNNSSVKWAALGDEQGKYQIRLGALWYDTEGNILEKAPERADLLYDLPPEHAETLELTLSTPSIPGTYTVKVNMVQELVAWFNSDNALTLSVVVVPN